MKHLPMPDLNYLKRRLDYCPNSGVFTYKVSNSNRVKIGQVAGCLNVNPKNPNDKYYQIMINKKKYRLHRLAYFYMTSVDPLENEIDHKDGNTLNNKFENLRLTTHADNTKNQKKSKGNTSGHKGVSFHKASKRWETRIQVNNKQIYLGLFKTLEEASATYQAAADYYFKDFKRPQSLE